MAVINPEWVTKEVGSFQTAEEMNTLATAVKNNAVELQTDITNLSTHINNKSNPHEVTKTQLNLENVDNVSDTNKPVSIAQAEAIAVVQTDINNHKANLSNPHEVTKAQVGLSEVDNTSDLNKPISIAQQTAINAASTVFNNHVNDIDNPHNVTKTQLGLSNVDNTSDLAKPISTATQNALNTKENISNKGIAGGYAGLDANGKIPENQLPSSTNDVLEYISFSYFPSIGESSKIYIAKDTNKLYRWEDSTYVYIKSGAVDSVAGKVGVITLDKDDVGLPNVDNTSDMDKPISNAQNIAFNDLRDDINGHKARTDNPHSVTKAQVGLSDVDNTSDANKPISLATQTALNTKTDKTRQIIAGAGLTGGGDLSTDRTLNVASANDGITVNVDNIQLNTIDNVTTTSVTKPLSANQGKVLDEKITQVGANLNENLDPALAEILNHLIGRIVALELIIKNGVYKNLQVDSLDVVKSFNIYGATNMIIPSTAAPAVVPDFLGQKIINSAGKVAYEAIGTSSVSDWKQSTN